eukprot:TRINITY_DN8482_c0_g2_i1.p1 TRINITY_DN8482_c0_g2~~TRINITY_DN8482_c0_g2_i1.p1  ORF type:complete len:181 (-),score=24.41 TRINITY_DN8482_c0_g2_i1:80-622(-)
MSHIKLNSSGSTVQSLTDSKSGSSVGKSDATIQLGFIGDTSASKPHLLTSYLTNKFPTDDVPDVFPARTVVIPHASSTVPLSIAIVDVDCRDESDEKRSSYYEKKFSLFIVAFSVMEPTSFDRVIKKWIPEINYHHPRVPFLIVGTKTDLRKDQRAIDKLKVKGLAPISTLKVSGLSTLL